MDWAVPDAVTQWNEIEASNEIERDNLGLHVCQRLWCPKEMRLSDSTRFAQAECRIGIKEIKAPDAATIDMLRSHVLHSMPRR